MNGNNPMQSEFSSYIGMTGKCFCRVCQVAKTRPDANNDCGEKQHLTDFVNVHMFDSIIHLVFIVFDRLGLHVQKLVLLRPSKVNYTKFYVVLLLALTRLQPQQVYTTGTSSILPTYSYRRAPPLKMHRKVILPSKERHT